MLTGLRPCEWTGSSVVDGQLVVKNAKHSNGRACGEFRRLDLAALAAGEIARIEQLSKRLSEGDYALAYAGCRKRLAWLAKALWPNRKKRPTLYSARHQFSADAKKSAMSKAELAACMGHQSQETAATHYGRRAAGRSPVRVSPCAENLAMAEGEKAPSPSQS